VGHFGSSGSGSVFLMRIRIQLTKMNADPCGSRSATLGVLKIPADPDLHHWKRFIQKEISQVFHIWFCPLSTEAKSYDGGKAWSSTNHSVGTGTLWSIRNKPSLQLINTNTTRSVLIFTVFRIRICLDADPGFFVTLKVIWHLSSFLFQFKSF
jgi:hypothetical protein